VQKSQEARPPASFDVLLTSGNRSLVREAAEVISSLFSHVASGSKGAADICATAICDCGRSAM
jgi:hypothetical protein